MSLGGRDQSPSGPAPRLATSIRLYLPLETIELPIEHALQEGTDLRAVRLCRCGAFGEIALPRRCSGEAGFMESSRAVAG